MTDRIRILSRLILALAFLGVAPLSADCTLQLSDTGIVPMSSGERRTLTWNSVPGAESYLVEALIEGLGDPAAPDFTFGSPYTESRNVEVKANITSIGVRHSVLYKMRFRYQVTALNRDDPTFEPCQADVLYVFEADQELASIANRRIVPIVGKSNGMNGAAYSTALVLAGSPLRTRTTEDEPRRYQGKIVFRALGQPPSESDPFVEYALDGDETLVYDDIMDALGVSGIGTIEVVPRGPLPLVDAILENQLPGGQRVSVRVPATWGREHFQPRDAVTLGIRSPQDSRVSFGVRSLANFGRIFFELLDSSGERIATAERFVGENVTMLFPLAELFDFPLSAGNRVIAHYQGFRTIHEGSRTLGLELHGGAILFLTETGNEINNPNLIYPPSLQEHAYAQGFDRFVLY